MGPRTRPIVSALALTALVGVNLSAHAGPTAASTAPVVLIMMENHEYTSIVGSAGAPYINESLIPGGTLFTNQYAITHPSLPNYLAITSASNDGCTTDGCPPDSITVNNLFHELGSTGISYATYAQSMPSPCDLANASPYAVRHNPEVYFTDLHRATCSATDLPYPSRLSAPLPAFVLVVPNLCNDMHTADGSGPCSGVTIPRTPHDCTPFVGTETLRICQGDDWLARHVPALVAAGATVIVTFDEGSTKDNGGGWILTVEDGAGVPAGTTNGTFFTHYSVLAGIERHFGLRRLQNAAGATVFPIP